MSDSQPSAPQPVGLLRRSVAIVYESLLLAAVLVIASAPVSIPLGITSDHPLFPFFVLYVYGVSFLYLGGFWVHGRQSLAMRAWELRIERLDGTNLNWRDAALRYAGTLPYWGLIVLAVQAQFHWPAPVAALLWGALVAALAATAFDPRKRMLQDLLSRTRIVRTTGASAQTGDGDEAHAEEKH